MYTTVDKGGFQEAHAVNGDVRVSVMMLRTYWPNWLKIEGTMTETYVHMKRAK